MSPLFSFHPDDCDTPVGASQVNIRKLPDFTTHVLSFRIKQIEILAVNYCFESTPVAECSVANNVFARPAFARAAMSVNDLENAQRSYSSDLRYSIKQFSFNNVGMTRWMCNVDCQ